MRNMLQAELPREWNENRYLSECDIDLNPAMRLEKGRAERRATSRIGQRNSMICFYPECKCKESWCRAVAHTGLRVVAKWRQGISPRIQAVCWVGEGVWVPRWEPSVRQYWKEAMGNTSSAAAEGISFCKETLSCYWACENPCPCWILRFVSCVVPQIPEHWHICYVKCRSSGISRTWHVPGHRENKRLSGGTVTVSPELLLEIKHLSLGWKRILTWCKAALVDLAAARHFITLQ